MKKFARFVEIAGSPRFYYPLLTLVLVSYMFGWLMLDAFYVALVVLAVLGVSSFFISKKSKEKIRNE